MNEDEAMLRFYYKPMIMKHLILNDDDSECDLMMCKYDI